MQREDSKAMAWSSVLGLVCLLIVLWGLAMIMVGIAWANWTWLALGLAVLVVGLPFVRNILSRP